MNSSYWILITHIFSLYPIGIFSWSWKIRKDIHSVFMILNFIFCVLFSLFYHNHDIEGIPYNNSDYGIWSLLDSQKSTSLILTTGLYVSRVRDPYFYNFSYISNIITLILSLFKLPTFSTYYLILHLFINFIIKWRTIYRYLIKFKIISFITISWGFSNNLLLYCTQRRFQSNIHILSFIMAYVHILNRWFWKYFKIQIRSRTLSYYSST